MLSLLYLAKRLPTLTLNFSKSIVLILLLTFFYTRRSSFNVHGRGGGGLEYFSGEGAGLS